MKASHDTRAESEIVRCLGMEGLHVSIGIPESDMWPSPISSKTQCLACVIERQIPEKPLRRARKAEHGRCFTKGHGNCQKFVTVGVELPSESIGWFRISIRKPNKSSSSCSMPGTEENDVRLVGAVAGIGSGLTKVRYKTSDLNKD